MKNIVIALSVAACAAAPFALSASPVAVILGSDISTESGGQSLESHKLYSFYPRRVAIGPKFDEIDSIRFSAIGSASENDLIFTPSIDSSIGNLVLRKDSIARASTVGTTEQWSLSDLTGSAPPPISAISQRNGRTFVAFSSWINQGADPIPPWTVAEIVDGELVRYVDLTDFGVAESARIKAMSVFPDDSLYFIFGSDSQMRGQRVSSEKVHRLDLADGLWFEESSMCVPKFGCIGKSVLAIEYAVNTQEVFSSNFEEYEE